MVKPKKICSLERVIRTLDFFGESFTFRYYDEDKLSSKLGGVVFIVFMIIAIVYSIINIIPFANKENFSLQYYTMNLDDTEKIPLSEEPAALAFGLTVEDNNTQYNIYDLFDLKVSFITKPKNGKKNTTNLNKHNCDNNNDFHKLHQKSFEDLKISELYCLKKTDLENNNIKGIYTDELFSYYEISVESKYKDNETHSQIINNFLIENDCKLQFYYTDITINLDDHENPYSSFLNSLFLQLNPTLIQKKNIFFMNYHLYDDDHFLHIFDNKEEQKNRTGLSRVEDYAIYKGLDRAVMQTEDYLIYAKMYIRVDNKKIEIKRRYQDFMEFFADTTALFSTLFLVLGAIFAYYDRVMANHSISKKLFYFEGIEGNKFNQLRKLKEFLTFNRMVDQGMETKVGNRVIVFKKNPNNNSELNNVNPINSKDTIENDNKNNKKEEDLSKNNKVNTINSQDTIENDNINNKKEEDLSENNKVYIINSQDAIENDYKNNKKEEDLINYDTYNIFEMIWSFSSKCCKTKKFANKINLIEQSNDLIDDKLDIVFYIRNMFLFEYINKIYLDNKTIVNFLSRPIIYLTDEKKEKEQEKIIKYESSLNGTNDSSEINDEEPNSSDEKYRTAYRLKSNILGKKIDKLVKLNNKTKADKRLVKLLQKRLDGV